MSALRIVELEAGYGKRPVLGGIDLPAIEPGRVVALIGRNAAGKSTLLKAVAGGPVAGALRSRGSVRLGDTALAGLTHRQRAQRVGYLPQAPIQPSTLLAWEVALSTFRATRPDLGRNAVERRLEAVFRDFDLEAFALRPVQALSTGKRQLLGLAMIVARETPLLLLDEPTSALDLAWQIRALAAVRQAARERGAIAIVAVHDLNLALRFADDAVCLHGGGVAAAGPVEDVIEPALVRRVFGVAARREPCSRGHPVLLVDDAVPAAHSLATPAKE
jgi:iron complex transport system ATP-binding protein